MAFCSNAAAQGSTAGVLAIVNLLSGQALLRLSVFALGIMPYITASIILQLLTVVIPRLETLKQEGQAGQAKITQYTRYLTVGLAVLQSTGYVELAQVGHPVQRLRGVRHRQPADPERLDLHHRHDGDHHGGGHHGHHVDGRADHRPRRRQRHVGADLHHGHLGHPGRDPGHLPGQGGVLRGHRHRRGRRHRRVHRVHGAGAAPHPGAVRQADGGPPDVRRHLDLHPDEGEPGRRHPGHLRLVAALHPDAGGPAVRQPEQAAGLGGLGRPLRRAEQLACSTCSPSSC